MPRRTTPAPMTMVFGQCGGITNDALMTDSLHRACPARFSGSVLSRRPPPGGMPDGTPASAQFQAEPRSDARIFCRRTVGAARTRLWRVIGAGLLTFSRRLPHSLGDTRPFAGARPHGHPPLSLRPRYRGLFFCSQAALRRPRFWADQSLRSSGSAAASTISPTVSIGPLSLARSAPAAVRPCTGQSRSRANGSSRPPCPGLGSGQVQPSARASDEPGRGSCRSAIQLKPIDSRFVPCRIFADLSYRNRQTGGEFSEAGDMRLRLGVRSFALILGLIAAAPAWAADPAPDQFKPDQFKTEIESFLGKLDGITSGLVTWEGSDSFDSRQEGDTAIAVMTNARLAIHGHDQGHDTA